jgi:8-oxo-dGTP pyrophosphatase MutT (NUDIX family)
MRAWWFVRRPHTIGVKVLARDGDRVLFVRHTYGDRRGWDLPGGGARRRESPADAARREAREELGVDPPAWRPVAVVEVSGMGKRTTMHIFEAPVDPGVIRLQAEELAEGRWAPQLDPPEPLARDAGDVLAALPAVARRRGDHHAGS